MKIQKKSIIRVTDDDFYVSRVDMLYVYASLLNDRESLSRLGHTSVQHVLLGPSIGSTTL
jgi:hypothetical protein